MGGRVYMSVKVALAWARVYEREGGIGMGGRGPREIGSARQVVDRGG